MQRREQSEGLRGAGKVQRAPEGDVCFAFFQNVSRALMEEAGAHGRCWARDAGKRGAAVVDWLPGPGPSDTGGSGDTPATASQTKPAPRHGRPSGMDHGP